MKRRLWAVDAGNTRVKYCLFENGRVLEFHHEPTDEAGAGCQRWLSKADAPVCLSSVVPHATHAITSWCRRHRRELTQLSAASQTLFKRVHPETGTDLVAQAYAAWKLYRRPRTTLLVLGFGTATTALTINPRKEVVGGWFHPGINSSLKAMHDQTALLPYLGMSEPATALGTTTETFMRNGVWNAHVGLVKEWKRQVELQLRRDVTVVATGGWAESLSQHGCPFDTVDKALTLRGIWLLWNDARKRAAA